MKRKLQDSKAVHSPAPPVKKQLRSNLLRRKRSHISPIILNNNSVNNNEVRRIITRAYYRKINLQNKQESSEFSCVDSCSEVTGAKSHEFHKEIDVSEAVSKSGVSSVQSKIMKRENSVDFESYYEVSEAVSKSGISSVQSKIMNTEYSVDFDAKNASKINDEEEEVVSKSKIMKTENSVDFDAKYEVSEAVSKSKIMKCESSVDFESNYDVSGAVSKSGISSTEKFPGKKFMKTDNSVDFDAKNTSKINEEYGEEEVVSESKYENSVENRGVNYNIDLECSEHFSNYTEELSDEYSSAYSDLQSELFPESDFSDYSPSLWYDSGSQFSEKSNTDSTPSPTFTLFLKFSQQFYRSSFTFQIRNDDHHMISPEFTGLDEEDEESYMMIRNRERKQVYLHDYAEEYCSTTEYGDLIVQQRLLMVHWILEQATKRDLQKETMFLSVNLLDRFLSKGYFKTKRCLQVAAIACLTLAIRIEENQPYNSIRQKTFIVAGNAYSCCEVVAMEWLVQEVLNFQCLLPTVYNFLWFYLKAARAPEYVERNAKYLAVVALLGHEHLSYRPSTVASAMVILASSAADLYASCHLVTKTHAKIKDDDLPECIKSLEWLATYI